MELESVLLYLIQCRAAEFRVKFARAVSCGLTREDEFKGYPLYVYAAAIRELLTEEVESEVFDFARRGNDEIWGCLSAAGFIPDDYQGRLIDFAKDWTTCDTSDSYEEIFDMSLPDLEARGVRKIDCDLYIVGCALNFERARDLLAKGGNPDARIGADDSDYYNVLDHCYDYWNDIYAPCEYILETWARGKEGVDVKINRTMCYQLILSAGYKMMYDLLKKKGD